MRPRLAARPAPCRCAGLALVVALVMLAVVLLLALGALRMVTGEARMTGYQQDRHLAFQAAESALREAEELAGQLQPRPAAAQCADFSDGARTLHACGRIPPDSPARWRDPAFPGWRAASPLGTGTLRVPAATLTEYLGNGFPCSDDPDDAPACSRYRITARAGSAGRAQVLLQSLYATD